MLAGGVRKGQGGNLDRLEERIQTNQSRCGFEKHSGVKLRGKSKRVGTLSGCTRCLSARGLHGQGSGSVPRGSFTWAEGAEQRLTYRSQTM